MGKILIESKDIPSLTVLFPQHLYLVYVDDAGQEFVLRGGPTNDSPLDFGPILVEPGVPIALSEDRRVDQDNNPISLVERNSRELNLGGRDAVDVWNIMRQQASAISNQQVAERRCGQ